MDRIVVVGGGLAGSRAVEALREQGYTGRLTLLAAESHLPYDRPPLSKAVLSGTTDDTSLRPSYDDLGAELLLGCRATGLRDGMLETDAGELAWDGLVLASGAVPRTLPGTVSDDHTHVTVLRTIEDAHRIRSALAAGARVVVVGAGWIGAEVATAAAATGCPVTVVEAGPTPLCQALGVEVGAQTTAWYRTAGIDLRLGHRVVAVEPGTVVLDSGERLPADCIVVGIGVRADVGWLAGSPVNLDGGVVADEHCRTSMPGVVAVGDCAAWWSPRFATRLRVEHWDNALRAPSVAATTLLGGTTVYDPVPYFWSEQFGRTMQYAGHHDAADEVVWRADADAETGSWTVCWLRARRLVATLAVDRPRDLLQARKAIAQGVVVDAGRLADPTRPLRSAIAD